MLFDRYKQVELRDSKKGSGLGLAICKQIIEQHGGCTGVESKMGRGSRFWFRIPSKPPSAQPAAPQQASFYAVCPGFDRSST
jgi:signal transduction histidine kinase